MSLSMFQTKYTSEDNESFYKVLDRQNVKKRQKYAWMWNGNKILAPRQIAAVDFGFSFGVGFGFGKRNS
ncbi:hypothetical protein EMPG_15506 [Blastomyces silverae]|uniref:Uncharacterized protein n=1 Tax=Blastomyces silverae TaxID=2060906 RepID=A0A0H1BCI7_9EURO|nr:hypothetical protein EMPG_15506 [Blastomyces silverae]